MAKQNDFSLATCNSRIIRRSLISLLCFDLWLCLDISTAQFFNQCHPFELLLIVFRELKRMDLSFLRFHDTAKTLTAQVGNQTLPQIVFQSLLTLLEITDWVKISKKNKFLARTLYLEYLHGSDHPSMTQDMLLKIGLSCLYLALEIGGSQEEISTMIEFTIGTEYGTYYISEQHTQILATLNSLKAMNAPITTPYDFIAIAKDQVSLANFQRLASHVIDLALILPETCNVTSQQIFVASCLFISDRSFNESIIKMIEQEFSLAIGGGFEMKTLLSHAFLAVLEDQA